jgi:hypothetical protein
LDLSEQQLENTKEPKQLKITQFVAKVIIEAIVAKLAALDGFTINSITNSKYIRSTLLNTGFCLPKNSSSVMELIRRFYFSVIYDLKCALKNYVESNTRFSITLDTYTSIRNKRYMNINIHTPESF